MANLRLYFETESKQLSLSAFGPLGFQLPTLRQEDTMSLEISILRQVSTILAPLFEVQNISAYSLRVSVGTITAGVATIIVTTTAFTPSADGKSLLGTLDLKVAGISSLADNAEVFFEIIATINSTDYGKRFPTRVEKGVYTSGSLVAPAGDTALGRAEADRRYVKLEGTVGFVMYSVGGSKMFVQLNDDGTFTASPIT